MISQVEDLVNAFEAIHISPPKPKKSVRWAADIVDNNGKSGLLKEIRGLKRVNGVLCREYDHLRHLWDETKYGAIPEEYKNTKLSTSSEIFADIIIRLNELTSKKNACDDHIDMRVIALEWISSRPWLQT